MNVKQEQTKIIFNNNIEDISGVLNTSTSYILSKTNFPKESIFLSKIKWVLTELLTNAVKHCGAESTVLIIKILEEEIIFEKIDSGTPMHLYLQREDKIITYPYYNSAGNSKVLVYANQTDALIAHIQADKSILFYNTEIESTAGGESLSDVSEHFGLMIIAKCTDRFSYSFTEKDKTNRFICHFSIL
jgi:anti-sigma regulatory factor (Ser/Thr protein kinase)